VNLGPLDVIYFLIFTNLLLSHSGSPFRIRLKSGSSIFKNSFYFHEKNFMRRFFKKLCPKC
jgi:hypothetical protein